jgi:Astacin (Peptidase family M12A)
MLPRHQWVAAAGHAAWINPVNAPATHRAALAEPAWVPQPEFLALLTTRYWGAAGVRLTVGFLDNPSPELRERILGHMNAWNETANVQFEATATDPQVRIARLTGAEGGYWSYLGTEILSIAADAPTMNLEGFTMATPDAEFHRVVRHETGHTLGFVHEHLRRELVERIDPEKAIDYFGETQGWSPEMVRAQVLTPIEEGSLWGTTHVDPDSVMGYQIPGLITRDGQPILGGTDIDDLDYEFAASVYPKPGAPPDRLSGASLPSPLREAGC